MITPNVPVHLNTIVQAELHAGHWGRRVHKVRQLYSYDPTHICFYLLHHDQRGQTARELERALKRPGFDKYLLAYPETLPGCHFISL